jgi:CheY-like chemotaxis protein
MLQRLIGEDVQLVAVLNPKAGRVKADAGQVSQIIMNLAVNARDAMPTGGKLTIETANITFDEEYAWQHVGVISGEYVMLAISDTGTGMSAETQQHIFEPFFTTKEVGKGTGLGLATVYGIVKQSGGQIWVHSEMGGGTAFKIYLPRVTEEVEEEETKHPSDGLLRGTETILLVEDEEMVRMLARRILEECGYSVLEAGNGAEALALCDKHEGHIDMLMTDVVMPHMGGRELAERMAQMYPEMRILFTSGYTDDAVVRHGVIETGMNFIQKPFTPDGLAQKVREVLDIHREP